MTYILGAFLAAIVAYASYAMFFASKRFDPKGKFCYIPGGSAGLGKGLAEEIVRRGGNVVIVARDIKRANETVEGLKALAGPGQKVAAVQADLTSHEASSRALNEATALFGGNAPDYVFMCAGFAKPQLFIDVTPEDLKAGLDGVYWVSAWTAYAAVQMMVKQRKTGQLIFTASLLGYTSFAGYSPYSPGKYALRGLADTLRSEMQIHGINVHLYMPAGILSPGYENEQKTKPAITKKIEESDQPITPEQAAAYLIKGIERGHYQITNDLVTELMRVNSQGPVPGNGLFDAVLSVIGSIGLPVWRLITDGQVRGAKAQVEKDLNARGFFA